jgi:hypothetical protein
LLIGSNLALRSNTQQRVQILRVRQAPVLLYVAGGCACVFITAGPQSVFVCVCLSILHKKKMAFF